MEYMKDSILTSIALCMMMLATSCGHDSIDEAEHETIKHELSVSETSLSFPGSEQSQTLYVTCNSYWTISDHPYWLYLSSTSGKGDGSVTIRVAANPSATESRTGSFDITNGFKICTVSVSQEPSQEVLSLDNCSFQFTYNGGSSIVYVESNGQWTAKSDASWCLVSASPGYSKPGVKWSTFVTSFEYFEVMVENNFSFTSRYATITVSSGSLSQTVSITQSAASVPEVDDVYVSDITKTSANCQFGYSSSDLNVQKAGIYYRTSTSNDVCQSVTCFSRKGTLNFSLLGLVPNTTYYIRPFVNTTAGIVYGKETRFTTEKNNSPNESDNPTPSY